MKKRLKVIIPILLAVIICVFAYRFFTTKEDGSLLQFSGNIEVLDAQLSFQIPGKLLERLVNEGDNVQKGQVLARLENIDQAISLTRTEANLSYAEAVLAELEAGSRQEDLDRADAKVAQARQTLTELRNGTRIEELEGARAELESAQATEQSAKVQFSQAKKDIERYNRLYTENSISKNIVETYQTSFETAENQVKEAEARTKKAEKHLAMLTAGPRIEQVRRAEAGLRLAQAEYALVYAGPRQEQIEQARAKVLIAKENVKQAKRTLSYTELVAPMDAVVLSISAEQGEYLNPASPVLTLGQLSKPWLRAYIPEKALGHIKLNQKVTISTDSFPGKTYEGRLSYISSQAEFTPKTVQTFEERNKLMFRIKVELNNPDLELKPGMPADGTINLSVTSSN